MVSKNQVAWSLLIVAVTSLVALLAWRYPVATAIVLVLVTLALLPSAYLGFMIGMGFAGETVHLADYAWFFVFWPGPFLLAAALLFASKLSRADG